VRSQNDLAIGGADKAKLSRVIYAYATGYIPAFDGFYLEYKSGNVTTAPTNPDYDASHQRFGSQTFAAVYRLLAQMKILKQSASNRYEGVSFNVYTIYRDLITDFGVVGSLASVSVVAFMVTYVKRCLWMKKAWAIIFMALLITQMEFTLIYSLFGFIFYPMILLLSPTLVYWRADSRRVDNTAR
jgi:oligosaccharide repeat unit polymerase